MCLIVIAHRASDRFPLIIAANRDEDYERPALPASFWEDGEILGGRDVVHGGSWLAMTRGGRFAAVTNLRGSARTTQPRSRGELVAGFVRSKASPRAYLEAISERKAEYGGFHLLAGELEGELLQLSESVQLLPAGVHGLSNAPGNIRWPKVGIAVESLQGALQDTTSDAIVEHLMRLLRKSPSHDPTRDLFIEGDRYGTRASTVIVVEGNQIRFVEQSFGRGGVAIGKRIELSAAPR